MWGIALLPGRVLVVAGPLHGSKLGPFRVVFPIGVPPSEGRQFVMPGKLKGAKGILERRSIIPLFPVEAGSFLSLGVARVVQGIDQLSID